MDYSKLSSYQDPEGILKDRLAPRTEMRKDIFPWKLLRDIQTKTVLDLGCNNGYFTREAMKRGAKRAVGVDVSDAIVGARELAKQEGVDAEFWQANLDSPEFRKFCPRFDIVFCLSVITHVKDKVEFINWLDGIAKHIIVFESNHGERNKQHIEILKETMWFESITYIGPTDIPEKPHYMWVCKKASHESRYPIISSTEVQFIPIGKISGMDETIVMEQETTYDVHSETFNRLKTDIAKRGIRDPLVVKAKKDGSFGIVQGGHRYLAAKQLKYKDLPCRVVPQQLEKV